MTKRKYRYRKPYRVKKKKSILKNKFFWLVILVLIILGAVFYLVVLFPYFQIKDVAIFGNQKVPTQYIENIVREKIKINLVFFETQSIFLVNLKEIKQKILEKYPVIFEVKIKKVLPDILLVEIQERYPVGIWCQESDCFYLDYMAVVFEKTTDKLPIVIKPEVSKEIILGKAILEKKNLEAIFEIEETVRENLKIDIREYIISGDEKKLRVNISEGWYILFNLEENTKEKLFNLDLVLKEKIPQDRRGDLQYIDLRFGNRVYFKYRNQSI